SGAGISAAGSFTTVDTPDPSGFYLITAIAGERNGAAIVALQPTGTPIPGNEPFAVDNLVKVDSPQLTTLGFGFAIAGGTFANPFLREFLGRADLPRVLPGAALDLRASHRLLRHADSPSRNGNLGPAADRTRDARPRDAMAQTLVGAGRPPAPGRLLDRRGSVTSSGVTKGRPSIDPAPTRGLGRLGGAYVRRRYAILFYSLLFTLAAGPVTAALRFGGGLIESFLAANLLIAVLHVGRGKTRSLLIAVLSVLLLARLASAWLDHPALSAIALGAWTIVALMAAAAALRYAMRSRGVGAEQLYAALSAYLLAGIFLGLFYWVLQQLSPSTFVTATGEFSRTSAVYFSFVTLATLGYGDIVPRSDVARGLAVVEGIGGQL